MRSTFFVLLFAIITFFSRQAFADTPGPAPSCRRSTALLAVGSGVIALHYGFAVAGMATVTGSDGVRRRHDRAFLPVVRLLFTWESSQDCQGSGSGFCGLRNGVVAVGNVLRAYDAVAQARASLWRLSAHRTLVAASPASRLRPRRSA